MVDSHSSQTSNPLTSSPTHQNVWLAASWGKTFRFPPPQRPVMLTQVELVQLWITWHTRLQGDEDALSSSFTLNIYISQREAVVHLPKTPTVFFVCHRVKQPWMSFLNLFVELVSGFNPKEAVKQLPSSCRWTCAAACTGWFCFCGSCGIRNRIKLSAVGEGFSFFTTLLKQKTCKYMWFSILEIMNRPPVISATAATPGCRVAISLNLQTVKVLQESWGAHQSFLEKIILL